MFLFFFYNDTATTEIYTLSLHDALPIYHLLRSPAYKARIKAVSTGVVESRLRLYTDDLYRLEAILPPPPEQTAIVRLLYQDRKSTRLNSSHMSISYAVFCLKKKKKENNQRHHHDARRCKHRAPRRYLAAAHSRQRRLGHRQVFRV